MNVMVTRSQRLVAVLLVSTWCSARMPWAIAVLASHHGSHHVSLASLHRDADIVLHHHAGPHHVEREMVLHDGHWHDEHPYADHVIHSEGTGAALAAKRLVPQSGPLRLIARSSGAAHAFDRPGACRVLCASAATGPPSSPGTVVLRI